MNRSPVVLLLFALGSPSFAQEPEGTYPTRLLPPGTWDLHFGALGDGLLRDVGLSVSADYGLTVAGSGSLALGFELDGGTCLLGCEAFAGAGATWQNAVGLFRVAYHIPFSGETANVAASNVYGVALAGAAVMMHRTQSAATVSAGPAVGVGLGSLYFPGNGDKLFAGGEMRLLFAAGIGASPPWNLFGLGFRVTLGVRL